VPGARDHPRMEGRQAFDQSGRRFPSAIMNQALSGTPSRCMPAQPVSITSTCGTGRLDAAGNGTAAFDGGDGVLAISPVAHPCCGRLYGVYLSIADVIQKNHRPVSVFAVVGPKWRGPKWGGLEAGSPAERNREARWNNNRAFAICRRSHAEDVCFQCGVLRDAHAPGCQVSRRGRRREPHRRAGVNRRMVSRRGRGPPG